MKNDIYPLVVVLDRYNGVYSGGKWTAWNLSYVPSKIDADDVECADFFAKNMIVYGRGETPQEAIDDLKMILNCGIPDPDEEDEDEEEEKMEPTSVWKIEDIDNIWMSQEGDKMTLELKNKDDLTKIILTGEAIRNHNDNFPIILKSDMEEAKDTVSSLKKENEKLKAKSKEISDDNALLLETNKKLKEENERNKENLNSQYETLRELIQKNFKLKEELSMLKLNTPKADMEKLGEENEELKKKNKKLNHAADYWSKEYDILLEKFAKSQVKLAELKTPTIEYFADEKPSNNINHPSHYTGKYECIDVMQDVFGDEATNNFCLCNAFKYIWRACKKNGLEDVKKAVWYLNKYIEEEEKDGEDEVTRT